MRPIILSHSSFFTLPLLRTSSVLRTTQKRVSKSPWDRRGIAVESPWNRRLQFYSPFLIDAESRDRIPFFPAAEGSSSPMFHSRMTIRVEVSVVVESGKDVWRSEWCPQSSVVGHPSSCVLITQNLSFHPS